MVGEGKNRRALGDIGNLAIIRAVGGKPLPQVSRPSTRIMAYDNAALGLHNGNSHQNLSWASIAALYEPQFQSSFHADTIVDMINQGSYMNRFLAYVKWRFQGICPFPAGNSIGIMELLRKELSRSDVGMLNRLVIPKKFAVEYFPEICPINREQDVEVIPAIKDIALFFHDRSGKFWNFKYCCYSNQSFVFTQGWKGFVKEKK